MGLTETDMASVVGGQAACPVEKGRHYIWLLVSKVFLTLTKFGADVKSLISERQITSRTIPMCMLLVLNTECLFPVKDIQ